jgi:putative restriction endonuclease
MSSLRLLSKKELLEQVISAIEQSGWTATVIDANHPFRLMVTHDVISLELRIYVWNITRGGPRGRPPDEFRIQITGVRRIQTGARFTTLLLGWDDHYKIFAGWNASRYETFGASPALQVKEGTLSKARRMGLAIQPKLVRSGDETAEVVVAFRPELLATYFSDIAKYHSTTLRQKEAGLLARIGTTNPPTDAELASLSEDRRIAIRQVEQAVRNAKFRKIVLNAYNSRCAVCGLDLGIVQAAHIVPVAQQGTDEPCNGIALCANHHTAFDRNILTVDDNYSISINPKMVSTISASELSKILGGINALTVPKDQRLKPKPEYLQSRVKILKRMRNGR